MIKRAIIIILDSFGVGETPDAKDYSDEGGNKYGECPKKHTKTQRVEKKTVKQSDETQKTVTSVSKQSDSESAAELYLQGLKYYNTSYYDKAFELFRRAAKLGNSDAQYYAGLCYEFGYGVQIHLSSALYWYRIAANNNSAAKTKYEELVHNKRRYYRGVLLVILGVSVIVWVILRFTSKDPYTSWGCSICLFVASLFKLLFKSPWI